MRDSANITSTVHEHADTVLRVCTLYFHARPERDDAFQETFLKYAQSDREFADREHVKAWLIRVAANTCKDMLKKAEAKTVLLDEIDEAAKPSFHSEDDNPAADKLNDALQRLDEKYRVALFLMYYEGYTAKEIARIMEMPENTVYTNLARGREKLKEMLEHGEPR